VSLLTIPPITDPLGRHWHQPDLSGVLIDAEVAMMSRQTFSALAEYSTTTPTGVYEGKAWKARYANVWYLRWYDKDDGDPRGIPTPTRKIVILDET